jgi:DNA-binding NtrC family response regulator
MRIAALQFSAASHNGHPLRSELEPETLSTATSKHSPTAYVISQQDLTALRQLPASFVDRRTQVRGKELAKLLLGHTKIPLVRSHYTKPGRLLQGVQALLAKAMQLQEHNLYIIGADETVFTKLWNLAGTEAATEQDVDAKQDVLRTISGKSTMAQRLLELLPPEPVPADVAKRLIGESVEMQLTHQLILRAARIADPVLLLGDTGTGKEVVARCIHEQSQRHGFVPVNCGAIPSELLEAVLFGAEKGSYTDAKERKDGLWKTAAQGTLFLDEIGDLRPDHQVKILRALQESTIRPVGAKQEIAVQARVIAATNRDLYAMVQAGQFREDLYYRLRTFTIRMPALRDHPADIAHLAQFFWQRITNHEESALPDAILRRLQAYRWPGNARELKAMLVQLHALFGAHHLSVEHVEAVFQLQGQTAPLAPASEQELRLHPVECLRHLRRVAEVLQACKVTLRPLVVECQTDAQTVALVQARLGHPLRELEMLCAHSLLFSSELTFTVIDRLREGLFAFYRALPGNVDAALRAWETNVAEDCRLAVSSIFREVERLTANV